ncbi:MAG: FxLYD domain-containing protein [Candidatus Nitrosocosmicus sp.]
MNFLYFSNDIKDVVKLKSQNIASNPINNVRVILHLYGAQGNTIGLTQALPTPFNLGIGQTTLFDLQENLTSLTGKIFI